MTSGLENYLITATRHRQQDKDGKHVGQRKTAYANAHVTGERPRRRVRKHAFAHIDGARFYQGPETSTSCGIQYKAFIFVVIGSENSTTFACMTFSF